VKSKKERENDTVNKLRRDETRSPRITADIYTKIPLKSALIHGQNFLTC
jgi:hypothetical protein